MMTMIKDRSAMRAIRAKLYAVASYYAYADFKAMNAKGRRYSRDGTPLPFKPYSLSPLAQEARKHYAQAMNDTWTDEAENAVKGYLMRLRLSGELDEILDWEKNTGNRYERNPWRDDKEAAKE